MVGSNQHQELVQTVLDVLVNHKELAEAADQYAHAQLGKVGLHHDGDESNPLAESIEELYYGLLTEFQYSIVTRALGFLSNPEQS